jgi:hypothetical protein
MATSETIGQTNISFGNYIASTSTEVEIVRLVTKLDQGNDNDPDNRAQNAKGYVFGVKYNFKVTQFTAGPPDRESRIKWRITYWVNKQRYYIPLDVTGSNVWVEMKYPDLCGRFMIVEAYISQKGHGPQVFHHNRFRWFNKYTIHEQAMERAKNPWKINQGGTSLCGMAAVFYLFAQKAPELYVTMVNSIFRTGSYTIGDYTIEPQPSAKYDMYTTIPNSAKYKNMEIPGADWILLATARSGLSGSNATPVYKGIEPKDWRRTIAMLGAVNWPSTMEYLLGKILFRNVKSYHLDYPSIYDRKKVNNSDFAYTQLNKINQVHAEYLLNRNVILMIDSNMIYNKSSQELGDIFTNSHWVVYEGGLKTFDKNNKPTYNMESIRFISFNIYTWGIDPKLKRLNISLDVLKTTLYGYIVGH